MSIASKMKEAAEALLTVKQSEQAAFDLATYRQFRALKDPSSPKHNPHAALLLAGRDYDTIKRGRELDEKLSADEDRAKTSETLAQAVAAALSKTPPPGAPPTPAPPPAA